MKTTVEISDDLVKKAKALAVKRDSTLRQVIEQGIRSVLKDEENAGKFELPDRSVDGEGLQAEFRQKTWPEIRNAAYEGRGG